MVESVEEIVSEAKAHIEKKGCTKFPCRTDQMMVVLEARGAIPIHINQELIKGETYLSEVSYKNITLICITTEPVKELKRYLEHKQSS